MTERQRRILERTGKRYIPRPKVPPIGLSLGNTSNLHRHRTAWEKHEDLPTKRRIVATLYDWFRV